MPVDYFLFREGFSNESNTDTLVQKQDNSYTVVLQQPLIHTYQENNNRTSVNYHALSPGSWNIMYNLYINLTTFTIIVKVPLYWHDNRLANARAIENIIRKVRHILRKTFANGNTPAFSLNFLPVNNKWAQIIQYIVENWKCKFCNGVPI